MIQLTTFALVSIIFAVVCGSVLAYIGMTSIRSGTKAQYCLCIAHCLRSATWSGGGSYSEIRTDRAYRRYLAHKYSSGSALCQRSHAECKELAQPLVLRECRAPFLFAFSRIRRLSTFLYFCFFYTFQAKLEMCRKSKNIKKECLMQRSCMNSCVENVEAKGGQRSFI